MDHGQLDESMEADDFEDKELEHQIAFASLGRVSCFAHPLQLVVNKFTTINMVLSAFKPILKRAHSIVGKVNSSTKATEKLISLAGMKLVRDCPTRWSLTFLMINF